MQLVNSKLARGWRRFTLISPLNVCDHYYWDACSSFKQCVANYC